MTGLVHAKIGLTRVDTVSFDQDLVRVQMAQFHEPVKTCCSDSSGVSTSVSTVSSGCSGTS